MLTFLYSVQVCTKNVSVKIINEQFVLSFDNLCPQFGASVSVRIEANFPNGRNTFNKKIYLNENRSGSGTINCSNAQWGMSCEETIRGLKQNFEADVSFRGANQQVDNYYDIIVDVDTKSGLNLGLIIGCSVGAVIIAVAVVVGFVVYKKKHSYTKQVNDGQRMTIQNAPETM
ncbi:Hypothetical_protein [Hexamita inflata]|uniref:Hypothetical_protein n=1 Tax=Hexamita inflata TaxID=28002 RepID=A0AA86NWP5_9EUKA|nr:Hypothetical protein HINF_LOCUS14272 [Hexamita inflata]